MEDLYRKILAEVGEDPDREGLKNTPRRASEALRFLTRGYKQDAKEILNGAVFHESYEHMILVKDIEFYSLCEHHLLPFFGQAHVAYVPKGKIIGLSKIARLVDMYARRLQVQERMTQEIANALSDAIEPMGVAVVLRAKHLCMIMRGVEKQHSSMITSAMTGCFLQDSRTRNELMELLRDSIHE
ncbi:MAG TPA: GTP cyclohydrolase I FolE [Armatimonadota bacterium]